MFAKGPSRKELCNDVHNLEIDLRLAREHYSEKTEKVILLESELKLEQDRNATLVKEISELKMR